MKWPLPKKTDQEKINRLASMLREGMQETTLTEGEDGSPMQCTDFDF